MRFTLEMVELHPTVAEQIKRHAREQKEKGGYEAVGFVAKPRGKNVGVATLAMNNHASNPTEAFFVEPWEQFRAEQKLEAEGYEILGVYHSHPTSEALPSKSDHLMARAGEYVFIYSVTFDDLRAYKENDGVLDPVGIE